MGINTRTLIAKEDLKKIDVYDLQNIYQRLSFGRFYSFREKFKLSDDVWEISIKDLVTHLASVTDVKQEYRDSVVGYVGKDILFVADSKECNEEKYVSVWSFIHLAIQTALDNAKNGVFPKDG